VNEKHQEFLRTLAAQRASDPRLPRFAQAWWQRRALRYRGWEERQRELSMLQGMMNTPSALRNGALGAANVMPDLWFLWPIAAAPFVYLGPWL
jgi:hypothetical protein